MSAASEFAPHYCASDYLLWKGDWELWDGIAIAMTPSPFGIHQRSVLALAYALMTAIREQECAATVIAELDWIVQQDTVVRPDLMIVCGDPPDQHLHESPNLVAEILSPSTKRNDQTYKRQLYQREGVRTYMMLDPESKSIEQLTLSPSGEYQSVDAGKTLEITGCDDCRLSIDRGEFF